MNQGRTVFSQLIAFLPDREFRRCVARYEGDARLRDFSCWHEGMLLCRAALPVSELSKGHGQILVPLAIGRFAGWAHNSR